MSKQDMRRKRRQMVADAGRILEKAEDEGRDMTPSEAKRFDALHKKAKELDYRMELGQTTDYGPVSGLTDPDPNRRYSYEADDGPRVLGPGDSLTDHLEARGRFDRLPDGIEPRELSLGRWFRGLVTGDWRNAEAERRAMSTTDDTLGGYMVPEPLAARVIDKARARSVAFRLGAVMVEMDSKTLDLAKITGDPTAVWKPEADAFTESETTLGNLELQAKTLGALTRMSIELVEDARNISDTVERVMSEAIRTEWDRALLLGNGADEPKGIENWDVNEQAHDAALSNYDPFSQAVQKIAEADGPSEGLGLAIHPRDMGTLDRLKGTDDQPLTPPESWQNLRRLVSSQLPTDRGTGDDESLAIIGSWRELLVGVRTNLRVEVSREAEDAFTEGDVLVRAYLRTDSVLGREKFFTKITGIG